MDEEKFVRKDLFEEYRRSESEKYDAYDKRIDDLKSSVGWNFGVLSAMFALSQILIAVVLYLITR